ncbi:barstar family protein [Streptomyces sp. HB132]|uniref:barstar family protein n=1 Tax=Streptomyces sp. HB132 TaxID=767388 RepID=UPI001960EBAD
MTGRTYVARLDGREMRDTDSVVQQFYDGLQVPDCFGWNRDALSDCLRDLKWLPANHCVLIVEAADEALSDDAAGRRSLVRTLLRAGRRWSSAQGPEGTDLSRLVAVMSCDAASVSGVRVHCDRAGKRRPRHRNLIAGMPHTALASVEHGAPSTPSRNALSYSCAAASPRPTPTFGRTGPTRDVGTVSRGLEGPARRPAGDHGRRGHSGPGPRLPVVRVTES